jgi:putative PIN family toxin of toxin-antitoxin system
VKIVLDTNVLMSGLFFGGMPRRIVDACMAGRVALIASPDIWDEYEQTATELAKSHALPALSRMMHLLASRVTLVAPVALEQPICRDPDDDKFIAAALSADVQHIVSGDKDLRVVKLPGLQVHTPRQFVDKFSLVL